MSVSSAVPAPARASPSRRLAERVRALAATAAGLTERPFLSRVHVQAIDAASLEGEPALGLAARLHAGLRQPYPDLSRELGHAARDPHLVLREINEKLDDARRRLDSERRALDDAGSRRARLAETVLYEAAGSQVDAFARANRAQIEQRFRSFGIFGDPLRDYKDHVQYVSGAGKFGLTLRAHLRLQGPAEAHRSGDPDGCARHRPRHRDRHPELLAGGPARRPPRRVVRSPTGSTPT